MDRTKAERWRTAIHEAGHAVIGRALGLRCGLATIVPNEAEGEAGHAINDSQWLTLEAWEKLGLAREVRHAVRGRIMAFMAGAEAEIVFFGNCAGGDSDDRVKIEEMAESSDSYLSREDWECLEPRMRRQVHRLVKNHRARIERVASALMERETLPSAEIDRLLV